MQFTIERVKENELNMIRLKDKESGTVVSILPEHGALLHEFTIVTNDRSQNIIENYATREILEDELDKSYRSAKLSPFVCRIDKGRYKFGDTDYEITKKYDDGSAIHGLLYNRPFEAVEQFVNENNACVRLRYEYQQEDPGYPFHFSCTVSFVLLANRVLKISTDIHNLDNKSIPVSDGWHPYFRLGGNIETWELQFPTSKRVQFNERLVPTGLFEEDDRFLAKRAIGNDKIDNCYLIEFPAGTDPECILTNPETGTSVTVYANSGYPYLQIFTAVHRESVAIENLSGAPDCFNNKMGLVVLKPGEKQSFEVRYKVD